MAARLRTRRIRRSSDVSKLRSVIRRIYALFMIRITTLALALIALPAAAAPGLSRSSVQSTMKRATPDVLACGTGLDDEVVAKFTISPSGAVGRIKIEGPHAKDAVGKCMKQHLAALQFPAADKATPVRYPFQFWASAKAQPAARSATTRLARSDLEALLNVLEDDLKKCGDGTAKTSFLIEPTGKPKDVVVQDVDDKTSDCVSKRISRVRFPATQKPTNVQREFSLEDDAPPPAAANPTAAPAPAPDKPKAPGPDDWDPLETEG
jgi:hypothetical protein